MQPASGVRPAVVAGGIGLIALVLGFLGYERVEGEEISFTDSVFQSLQLFALEGDVPKTGTPWMLDIARFLAPAVVVYAAVVTVLALVRDRAERIRVKHFARGHLVIFGLGATGSVVAGAMRAAGPSRARAARTRGRRRFVVAVEAHGGSARIADARRNGVRVILGDATQSSSAVAARVARAEHVVFLTGDDSQNLLALAAAQSVVPKRGRQPTFHVAVGDQVLWKELTELQLASAGTGFTTEFFNLADRAAIALVAEASRLGGSSSLDDVLIEGKGPVAGRVVVHLVRRGQLARRRPDIRVVDREGGNLLRRLEATEPWCFQSATLREVGDGLTAADAPPVAIVCGTEGDAALLGRGVAAARAWPETQVLVGVYQDESQRVLDRTAALHPHVHPVSAKLTALADQLFERAGVEVIARARHEQYVRRALERGETVDANDSLVPWDNLQPSLQASNRRFAQSVGDVVAQLHATIRPLAGPVADGDLVLADESLETLARFEHERWMRDLERDGWSVTQGNKDPLKKLHPLLVPWEDLSDHEKAKDRDAIRALPQMLSLVGYELVIDQGRRSA